MPTIPLPSDTGMPGHVFSVPAGARLFLESAGGIPSEYVNPGDIIASDGRMWYHVTRSDAPGSNTFYPNAMELELFRLAINDAMLSYNTTFQLVFDLSLQMFKQSCNVQYQLVVEVANLPQDVSPPPTGPNLLDVEWEWLPILQQRIIVTDVLTTGNFGVQVIRARDGTLKTNKKLYNFVAAGDMIPDSPIFALRARLVQFDTEDNLSAQSGLIYWLLEKVEANIK